MFRRFGSDVTIVHRDDHVLPREDSDVTVVFQKALEKEGIRSLLRARPTRVERQNGQIVLKVETAGGSEDVRGSHLLVTTERRTNTDDLEMQYTGHTHTHECFVN